MHAYLLLKTINENEIHLFIPLFIPILRKNHGATLGDK